MMNGDFVVPFEEIVPTTNNGDNVSVAEAVASITVGNAEGEGEMIEEVILPDEQQQQIVQGEEMVVVQVRVYSTVCTKRRRETLLY